MKVGPWRHQCQVHAYPISLRLPLPDNGRTRLWYPHSSWNLRGSLISMHKSSACLVAHMIRSLLISLNFFCQLSKYCRFLAQQKLKSCRLRYITVHLQPCTTRTWIYLTWSTTRHFCLWLAMFHLSPLFSKQSLSPAILIRVLEFSLRLSDRRYTLGLTSFDSTLDQALFLHMSTMLAFIPGSRRFGSV